MNKKIRMNRKLKLKRKNMFKTREYKRKMLFET